MSDPRDQLQHAPDYSYARASFGTEVPKWAFLTLDVAVCLRMKATGEDHATACRWLIENSELRKVEGFDREMYVLTTDDSTLLMSP